MRAAHVEDVPAPSLNDFTVACICPLGVECAANAYTFGRLGKHYVVVAVMPQIGNNAAATTATQVLNDFPSLRFGLLVGIGGGVPVEPDPDVHDEAISQKRDVRLGDVVVSESTDVFGGVVQFDLGKHLAEGNFQRTDHLNKPPRVLSANLKRLDSQHRRVGSQIVAHVEEMLRRYPIMRREYQHPGAQQDRLFRAEYVHRSGVTCKDCDEGHIVPRRIRSDKHPQIHYGTIGSSNAVVKDAKTRDVLRKDMDIMCVEMEATGLMDTFPCLVIRGICDYADSHKNKRWQPYAAATAAAYMKELLMMIPPQQVKESAKAEELMEAGQSYSTLASGYFESLSLRSGYVLKSLG
ncbi:purine and uridine phosphorylase [Aspergillus karnatakaensis]|uniref:purine and uridine phosphorylase n=1 Tax=Aspergillus karnatakaensis TaxID=1810916 RepID=UPI003CCCD47F